MDWVKSFDKIIKYSFYLLFFLTPLIFSPINYELFEFPKMYFVYLMTTIIMATWLGKMIVATEFKLRRTPLDIPILLYLISSVLSTIFSIDPYTSVWGYYSRSHGGLLSTICYILLYYAFLSNTTPKRTIKTIRVILSSGFVVATYGILERLGIDAQYWIQDVQNRVFSTLGQPNWLGAFMAAIIFLPLSLCLSRRFGRGSRAGLCLAGTVYLLCLIFTNSKSALLAFWLSFFLFLILKTILLKDKLLKNLSLLIPILLIYLLLGSKTYSYLKKAPYWLKIFTKQEQKALSETVAQPEKPFISESSEIRKVVWQGAIKIWQHYPILGSGLETFGYSYYNFKPIEHNLTSEWDFLYNKAHNEFLNILACQGIVGLVTYLFLIGSFTIYSLRHIISKKKLKNSLYTIYYILYISLFCGYTSILITNFFGFSVVITGLLFWFLPAFCFTFSREKQEKDKTIVLRFSLNEPIKYGLIIIIFSSLLFTVYCLLKRFRADVHYNKGEKFYKTDYLVPALTQLEQAVQLNPQEALYFAYLAKTSAKLAVVYAEMEATESAEMGQQLADLAKNSIERTLDLNKVHLNFWKNKAEVYLLLSYFESDYRQQAKGALMEAKRLAPTDAKIVYNLGLLEEQDKNFLRAIYLWEQAIQLKPNYEKVYLKLAETYLKIGEKGQAEAKAEFVLENLNSSQPQALEILSQL